MPQANWVILLHFLLLWGSAITAIAAGWHINIPLVAAAPLGAMLWLLGLFYNLSTIRRQRHSPARHRATPAHRSILRITARTLMNLGVALGFRSWPTLVAAIIIIPFYTTAARRRERYLDYVRTGMLSDAFPDRIVKH